MQSAIFNLEKNVIHFELFRQKFCLIPVRTSFNIDFLQVGRLDGLVLRAFVFSEYHELYH
jgi:hypothetical protein